MRHVPRYMNLLLCFILLTKLIYFVDSYIQLGSDILSPDSGDENAAAIDISNDGKYIAVGSPHAGTPDQPNRGEVKIYKLSTDERGELGWEQIGNTIVGKQPGMHTGIAVALSYDAKRLVVGSLVNDINRKSTISVFYYKEESRKWKWITTIEGESVDDKFGFVVDISSNGNKVIGAALSYVKVYKCTNTQCEDNGSTIVVDNTLKVRDVSLASGGQSLAIGAIANITNIPNTTNTGTISDTAPSSVKAYTFDGSEWQEKANFLSTNGDRAGFSVAISQNSNNITLAYGAPLASCQNGDNFCGTIKVFSSSNRGLTFTQWGKTIEGTKGSALGLSVALSVDRTTIVATSLNSNAEPVATVYAWDELLSNWELVQKLSSDPDSSPESSASIDSRINADGSRVVFLSPSGLNNSTNVVRVYENSSNPPTSAPSPFLTGITDENCTKQDYNGRKGKGKGKGKSCKSVKSKSKGGSGSGSSSRRQRGLRPHRKMH